MASSNSVLNIVIRARDLAKGTLSKITARLRGMGRASEQTENRFASLGRSIRNLVITSLGFYTIKKAMQGVLQTGDQFERLEVQMKAIMGSIEEGQRAIEWIKEFTKNTPLELEQVAQAFTALKNFGLDPMDGTLQAIVDQTSKLGGGMERLNGISLALGQAWAKQKLQGEEILQLVERGVPVWEMLEKVTGKNVQELQKLSSAGKLGRDTMRLLIQEIGASSAGAAADNMSLLSGLMANMADRWTEFKDAIAKAGWLDYIKAQLSELSNTLDEMEKNGQLQALAKSISDGFISMAESVRLSLSQISFTDLVSNIQSSFQTISTALGSMRSAFVVTGNTLKFFFNSFTLTVKGLASVITSTLGEIAYGWSKLFEVVGADGIADKLKSTTDLLRSMSSAFAEEMAEDANDVRDAMTSIYEELIDSNQDAQQTIRQESKKTTASVEEDVVKLNSVYVESGQTAKKAFADAADALKQINAAETRTELADLAVKLSQAFADGTLTQEQYNEALSASREKLAELEDGAHSAADAARSLGDAVNEAGDKQAQGAERASGTLNGLVGFYNNITSELYGLSAQAEDTFLSMQGATQIDTTDTLGELGQLKTTLAETKEEAQALATANVGLDTTGIGHWMKDTATNAASVRAEFYKQKIALEDLVQSYENGSVTAQQMASDGENLADSLNLLDQQDLDRLNQSIEQANDSMQRLSDSTQGTLDNLQDELDRLQGRQGDIEQRRYEARKKDLELELDIAKQDGDAQAVSNLQKALSLNQSIRAEKQRQYQLQQQEKVQKQRDQQAQQEKSRIQTQRQPTQSRSPEKVIRLEYPGGQVDVGVKPGDEKRLLEALKNAGMRSA